MIIPISDLITTPIWLCSKAYRLQMQNKGSMFDVVGQYITNITGYTSFRAIVDSDYSYTLFESSSNNKKSKLSSLDSIDDDSIPLSELSRSIHSISELAEEEMSDFKVKYGIADPFD